MKCKTMYQFYNSATLKTRQMGDLLQIYTHFHAQKHKVIVIILPILETCLKKLFIHAICLQNQYFG